MKKIFIIALAATVLAVFTGCHIDVDTDFDHHHLNTLYVYNDSRWPVRDFFLETIDGYRDYPDDHYIGRDERGKITKLPDDEYRLWLHLGEFDWYCSGYTYINRNTNYYIKNHQRDDYFADRAAININAESNSSTESITVIDDDGNEFELVKQ